MKKIVTATIATAGLATIAFAGHDAQAAEQNNNGYNSNDAQSYSYTYTMMHKVIIITLGQEIGIQVN
ncbi:Secretory antigen precursor SsaA [Staphylococcus aureus]|nr:Secretory antigen precursor SsaA [Staphylococcus aureus]